MLRCISVSDFAKIDIQRCSVGKHFNFCRYYFLENQFSMQLNTSVNGHSSNSGWYYKEKAMWSSYHNGHGLGESLG
ncbi:hypothetical protein AQUCO_02500049v1 [Aquilegia coerulea]|uniref:Uncharacterized protein n=1 Tax=Aquilegia coerulea TaxID=218851 RepID=A0A2G5D974_AQUCA|nr:hypothetical protein AQUCO_02500049v1 [Aquilegia coerulea]